MKDSAVGAGIVVVPSAFKMIDQPHRWIKIKWWKLHKSSKFESLVRPPLLLGRT